MITVRQSGERGRAKFGWLDSRHTFSFGHYFDPEHMGFSELLVINEDRVAPSGGFDTHSHKDMEIISVVLEGALEHKDSIGNGSMIRPGDVQRMTAGSGISHSEFNPSADSAVHFLQIWVQPQVKNLPPSYEQTHFEDQSGLTLIASQNGAAGSVTVHQDVSLYLGQLANAESVGFDISAGRKVWLQLARGQLAVNGIALAQGDGIAVEQETALTIQSQSDSEFLLFDLP